MLSAIIDLVENNEYPLLAAEVKMPSGKIDKPVIQDNRDGTVSVKYDPREEGSHELVVKYNGEPVQGKQLTQA